MDTATLRRAVSKAWLPFLWLLVLALLGAHVLNVAAIRTDSTAVLLVVLLALLPQVARLRRMRFMDLEAEIDPQEVRELVATTRAATATADLPPQESRSHPLPYEELLDRDPNLALAQMRMDIEGALIAVAKNAGLEIENRSAVYVARYLSHNGVLSHDQYVAVQDVVSVCNRAIHGALVDRDTASDVVDAGIFLLRRLEAELDIHPSEQVVIEHDEVDRAVAASYRVETIVPLVEHPRRQTYRMTQEQLDRFLNGYEEYGEFLVRIEPIGPEAPPATLTS